MLVFFSFLVCLVWGCASTLFWIPEDELGRGYFQMNALVILGLMSLAVAARWLHPFEPFGATPAPAASALHVAYLSAFAYYAFIWRESWRGARLAAAVLLAALTLSIWQLGATLIASAPPIPAQPVLTRLALLTSATLLGWSLITMLLGHWYLVAPKLRFVHLSVFCWVLLAATLGRLLAVGSSLYSASTAPLLVEPSPWRLLTSFEGEAMFFWVRVLWGLAGPLLLGLMSLHCARRQSNQSATGILYVLVVGAFIGEITAYHLMLTTGVPV